MEAVIRVSGLGHYFGDKKVLNNIDLQIHSGEIFGLLGPSGAGKTTLIKIMTGQLKPTTGETMVFDRNSMELSQGGYKRIGIMMDHLGLYERFHCYDNLKFYTMLNGIKKTRINEVLKKVGLYDEAKTMVSNLSKGMRSRLLLARAILAEPMILLLDEPTSGLDPATAEEIHRLILEEKKKGTVIFLTTHNMAEAEKLCDRVALLNEGIIVECGNPREVCRKYNHKKKLLIHLADGRDIVLQQDKSSLKELSDYFTEGILETIHSTEPNLETVFMELTGRKFE